MDDIVTRLREGEQWHKKGYIEVPSGFYDFLADQIESERAKAADEIERLRQHVQTLDKACDQLEEQVAFWIQVSHNKKKRWWHRD